MSLKDLSECKVERLSLNKGQQNDDLIKNTVGDFGRWQFKISVLMALVKLPISWFQMSIVFLAPPTNFWCEKTEEYRNWTHTRWMDLIQPENTDYKQNGLNEGYCLMKNIEFNDSKTLISCLNGYGYNTTIFKSSITTEWNLVCDRQSLMDFSQVSLMCGVLLGNMIFAVLADKHGRKKILILCLVFQSVFGVLASVSPMLWLFILLRFLLALANGGTMVMSFVICMEVVGGKWRTIVPILYQIPFGLGYASMSGLAYLIRNWRQLHIALSLLSALYIFLMWLIPESPRWLLAVGRKDQAIVILTKAARENKKDLLLVDKAVEDLSNHFFRSDSNNINLRALFSTRKLCKRSFLLCANWALGGITFYSFSQYMGHIGQNIFFTSAIGGLISLPGTLICVFLVGHYGRRLTIMYAELLTATCFLLILAFPKGSYPYDWPRILFAGAGVTGFSISLPAMYLFTGELFPTVLRNSGIGFAMMFSRLASMLAPLIISLQYVASFLPLLVLSVATIIQALLVLPLPETKGTILPDSLRDLNKNQEPDDDSK